MRHYFQSLYKLIFPPRRPVVPHAADVLCAYFYALQNAHQDAIEMHRTEVIGGAQ